MSSIKLTASFYSGKMGNNSVVICINFLCPKLVSGKAQAGKNEYELFEGNHATQS
jgi:hypothetical protein